MGANERKLYGGIAIVLAAALLVAAGLWGAFIEARTAKAAGSTNTGR